MQQFKGRVVVPGTCTAEALVSHGGFNTLASYQMAMMFGDKQVKCEDQNNPDIYKKPMIGKALCLPQTIGSTTGGMVLFTVCSHGKQPACMLFSLPIDSLAASGAILGDVWTDSKMPVVDSLGDEFLQYVQTGMTTRRTLTACSATARCTPWAASAAATSGTWKTASRTAPTACCPTVGAATATSSPSTRNSWSWPRKTDKKRDGSRRLFFHHYSSSSVWSPLSQK